MPRKSLLAKHVISNQDEKVDLARQENIAIVEKVIKRDGHPFDRLSKLAVDTQDEAIERAALSDLNTYVLPRMRALETESTEKPVAVNINFDLSAKDG
jgi:hypothetical protein